MKLKRNYSISDNTHPMMFTPDIYAVRNRVLFARLFPKLLQVSEKQYIYMTRVHHDGSYNAANGEIG